MNINANNNLKPSFSGREEKKVASKKRTSSSNNSSMNKTIEDMAEQKAQVNKLAVKSSSAISKVDRDYVNLRDKFCAELEPKVIKANKDCWDFYINSTSENMERYQKSEDAVYDLYKNEDLYKKFQDLEEKGLSDKHLTKQIHDLVKSFDDELNSGDLKKQLREKENAIASKFNAYVPQIDGKDVSKAEISQILQKENDVELRKKAYEANVKAGDVIADDLVEFVKLRNEYAKSKGYKNFFEYNLKETFDVDADYLQNLLDEVHTNAFEMNQKLQKENKKELAKEYGIAEKDLKQYHYGLILKNNPAKDINDALKTKEQVVDICMNAYKNMGYDIDNMPITLDLFPRKNKNTHGFCFDIEAGKDARILANLTNNTNSIDTLCHELGHCVYDIGIDTKLPFLEKDAHPAVTEAVAMMMGDLQQKEDILKGLVSDDVLDRFKQDHKKSEAKFINRSMLIINFEKQMYENPDQNLPKLWHDLRVKYTGANKDEELNNEWATIPHYLSHPAYYQNYFRATLMKAQMYKSMKKDLGNLTENKDTAKYLDEKLFKYGTSVEESELIKMFTGSELSTDALCESLK